MKSRHSGMRALICGAALAIGTASGVAAKEMTALDIPMIGDIEMLKAGDQAPDFTLTDLAGTSYTLSENIGKAHLLVFWSIFCEPCKAEMPLIQRLYEEYKDKGLEVISIAMDGEPMVKSIQGLTKQQGYTFRVFIDQLTEDESFVVADPYGVAGTPTVYMVDKTGKITFAEVGRASKETLEEVVRKALP
ncbi:MAG: redoxin domain-containing protein [Deferrisomatales bacterium]|nr:redoxin domain-containing protein [Deferrisomatales bacterium]